MKISKSNISAYDLRSISKVARNCKNGHTVPKNRTRTNNPYALSKSKSKDT